MKEPRHTNIVEPDWTAGPRGSNSSDAFERIVNEVTRLIHECAHDLIMGRTPGVARLIVAQLAHVHGMAPRETQQSK